MSRHVRMLALVAASASVVGCGGDGGEGIPPGPGLRWHDSQPVWSPDGRHIAFVRGRKSFGLHILDTRNGSVRRLTPSGQDIWESQPSWSPNGRSIVFVRNATSAQSRDDELYRIDIDGRRLMRLTHNKRPDLLPIWLQPGSAIGFWRYPYNRLIDLRRRVEHALIDAGKSSQPAWSPDGSRIAVSSYKGGLAIARRGAKSLRTIVKLRGVRDVAWSADGSHLAFARAFASGPLGIFVIGRDGSGMRRVTDGGANDYEVVRRPIWSPDGKRIAFVLVNSSAPEWVHGLYVVGSDGGALRRLKIPIREKAISYAWSPDGRRLVIGGDQVDLSRSFPASPYPLILVDVETSTMKRLTQAG